MTGRLASIVNSGFVRSVATLSSGQMIAAAIPILAAPILGRLYLPSEYGVLAAYMSIASVLSAIGNWQYAQAIIVEGYNNKAEVLLRLCMLTSAITAVVALLIGLVIAFYPNLSPEWQQARLWFLALPVSAYIGGVSAAWNAMANRQQMYRLMAGIQVTAVSLSVIMSITMGTLGYGYVGLMSSYFLGQLVTVCLYRYITYKGQHKHQRRIGSRRLSALARKHKAFALFSMPSAFVGNFAMQLPIYVLGAMGAAEMIGLFSRARQLLSMPITLLGGSIAQVFQRRASVEYSAEGSCRKLFKKTLVVLGGIGIFPTILLAIFAPQLFEFYLGPDWRDAGNIARILAPMLYLRMTCGPLSIVLHVVGAQRSEFILSILTLVLVLFCVAYPFLLGLEGLFVVVGYSFAYSIAYMIALVRSYSVSAHNS